MERFWLPTIPCTPVDLVNRRAAGTGSVRWMRLAACADFNGHPITVSFKPHAVCGPVWNAEFYWAGRHVLGRGNLETCLAAALREYQRGAHGTRVDVYLDPAAQEPIEEQRRLARAAGFLPWNEEAERAHSAATLTGTHVAVQDALNWHSDALLALALEYEGPAAEWRQYRDKWLAERAADWRRS